jgi:DNA-binding NarL/FixJ family response regulator
VKKHRVLVIGEDNLFSNGVTLLLALNENLQIVNATSTEINAISGEIGRTNPDVIIINEHTAAADAQLIMALLKSHPNLRVITLSLAENRVNVYNNQAVTLTTGDDLITAITGIIS